MNEEKKQKDYVLPASILIAALLISISVVYGTGKKTGAPISPEQKDTTTAETDAPSPLNMRLVDETDHILGNPEAAVKVVEFSDLECPFCKRFQETMHQVLAAYPNQVAWVYRHSPIDSLHPKARQEAEASECAAELGGNDGFWKYIDRLLEITPSNNGLDLALLPQIATQVGLDRAKFETCLASGKYASRIAADLEDAVNSGGGGTPYSVVIGATGHRYVIPGALPFESDNPQVTSVRSIIEQALKQ